MDAAASGQVERMRRRRERREAGFDGLQRGDDLADALAGDVLKAAGFVDAGDGGGDIRAFGRLHAFGDFFDFRAGVHNLAGRLGGFLDDGVKLVRVDGYGTVVLRNPGSDGVAIVPLLQAATTPSSVANRK